MMGVCDDLEGTRHSLFWVRVGGHLRIDVGQVCILTVQPDTSVYTTVSVVGPNLCLFVHPQSIQVYQGRRFRLLRTLRRHCTSRVAARFGRSEAPKCSVGTSVPCLQQIIKLQRRLKTHHYRFRTLSHEQPTCPKWVGKGFIPRQRQNHAGQRRRHGTKRCVPNRISCQRSRRLAAPHY
jgi:hypothetical protein